jgi:hypothetical protein
MIRRIERWRQRHVPWLISGGQRRGEAAVDMGQDSRPGAEVRRDLDDVIGPAPGDGASRFGIGADVGATETIDRLLRVADYEESARAQTAVLPTRRAVVGDDAKQDFRLERAVSWNSSTKIC